MKPWFQSFLSRKKSPCIEIAILQRDVVLFHQQVFPLEEFHVGCSKHNPFPMQTSCLPMKRFTLVHFFSQQPEIQFTSTMRGVLFQREEFTTLDELKQSKKVHPTLQGYRFQFPSGSSLSLMLDPFVLSIRWSEDFSSNNNSYVPLFSGIYSQNRAFLSPCCPLSMGSMDILTFFCQKE